MDDANKKNNMKCSNCKKTGHNARTCKVKTECIICYEQTINGEVKTACGHIYCIGCFTKHIQKDSTCAYCRKPMDVLPPKKIDPATIVKKCILSDPTSDEIYVDFYRQISASIRSNPYMHTSDNRVKFICQEILDDITLDRSLWLFGMKICDEIMNGL